MKLYNTESREKLKEELAKDQLPRITLSFYQYHNLGNPSVFRDHLFLHFTEMDVRGRVYVAKEGINAQISVPAENKQPMIDFLNTINFLDGIRLNWAIEDDGKSFYKLKIKVRDKIVADGLNDSTFDVTDKGTHLSAEEFNQLTNQEKTILVDMRNHYESEVGHFEGAITPDVDSFREALEKVNDMIDDRKEQPLVMYCTGGIRCEKASAWFKHQGFKDVYQLEGGIIEYARQAEKQNLPNKFKGKNFVFDERLGERISEEVISVCHQCGEPADNHTNCVNEACHVLFIQCEKCKKEFANCCSSECQEIASMPIEEQRELRRGKVSQRNVFKKGRSAKLKYKKPQTA